MANTERRIIDANGKQFVPMNVEGSIGEENFINMPKLLTLAGMLGAIVGWIAVSRSSGYSLVGTLIVLVIILYVCSLLLRFVIFEEKLYYSMYREMKDGHVKSPYEFWNIASKQYTNKGTILNYNDAKIGVIVKLERGVITGRSESIKEEHFDAISDFYRELNRRKLKRVRINIMEPTGTDKRLNELDKLCNATDNYNLNRLVELSVTHIKNISNNTLTDVEYYLIYTDKIMLQDQFMMDVEDSLTVLMNGAYNGYEILGTNGTKDINEFAKQINFVDYFNTDEAALRIFKMNENRANTIRISRINISSREEVNVNVEDIVRIMKALGNNGKKAADTVRELTRNKVTVKGVDLEEIERGIIKKDNNGTSYNNNTDKNDNNDMIDF